MKKVVLFAGCLLLVAGSIAQNITQKIEKAYQQFEADSQLRHAISSFYVINAKTGEMVFDKNSQIGLAPASTQKIITAATAFELLGKDYRYKTELGYDTKESLLPIVCIRGSGDPTFGSGRFTVTKPEGIITTFTSELKKAGLKDIAANFRVDHSKFETKDIPDGWIMQDIGNYYGAGGGSLNWKENQYDLVLKSSDKIGGRVEIISMNGDKNAKPSFINELKAAEKGSGDNAYIYLPIGNADFYVRGTIPVNEESFTISGAVGESAAYFVTDFGNAIRSQSPNAGKGSYNSYSYSKFSDAVKIIYTHYSPSLDSIIYWFLQKSINLYGEALVKTFAYEKKGFGSTDSGVVIVRDFWKQKGIDDEELNIVDGSGLSPQNRVTTHAQVEILKYAKTKDWFPYFYNALPTYNGMKMKSGTIRDVKGFCGYQKATDGNEYIFSFLVNNYSGRSSAVVNKMYKVLDELK